jgi:hypothetical protein
MTHPGDEDARTPQSWQPGRSGYQLTGRPKHRDPARGFPPAHDARDPDYRPSHADGWNGARPGTGPDQDRPVAGTAGPDVLGSGPRRRGADNGHGAANGHGAHDGYGADRRNGADDGHSADDYHDPATELWSKDWGGGPWAAGRTGAAWTNRSGDGQGSNAGASGLSGSRTWTYGEDATGIGTLRGHSDSPPGSTLDGADSAMPAGPANPGSRARTTASAAPAAAVSSPSHEREARRARARERGGRSRALLVLAVAVVAAAALAAAAVYAFAGRQKAAAARTARPAQTQAPLPSPAPSVDLGKWQFITSRADDPVALTLGELYPAQVSAGPRGYLRTAQLATQSCRGAVFGTRLKAAVRKGCSQALRASYLSVNGKRMGTIGVLNLPTSGAATKAGKVVTAPGQFIQPLPGLHGATEKLGTGTGVVWAVAKGHYLILMWAQYANLHSLATSSDRKILLQLIDDLYQKTVNQSLTRRMVTGKPLTP